MDTKFNDYQRDTYRMDEARKSAKEFQKEHQRLQKKADFFNQNLDYRDFVFAPDGYEAPFLVLYIMTIPYLAGILFLYLFIAEANFELFATFNLTSYLIIWAIGYEVLAVSILLVIIASAIQYYSQKRKEANNKGFRRDF